MNITVFLADDHGVIRDGLRVLLEAQSDIRVIGEAADGREAVRQVTRLCPDVVVMDITMPELDGISAMREIEKTCPSVEAVFLSIHSSTEHVFQALQAGALGFLLKESAGEEVIKAVRAVHDGHRYLSRKISDRLIDNYVRLRQNAEEKGPLTRLSPREREVLQLVVEGNSNKEIASALSLSTKTVATYRSRLMDKLDIDDLPGLVKFAIRHGLTPLE